MWEPYFNIMEMKKENNPFNHKNWCDFCKKFEDRDSSFADDETFMRIDVQVTDMRWDDDVYCFHKKCLKDWKYWLNNIY